MAEFLTRPVDEVQPLLSKRQPGELELALTNLPLGTALYAPMPEGKFHSMYYFQSWCRTRAMRARGDALWHLPMASEREGVWIWWEPKKNGVHPDA